MKNIFSILADQLKGDLLALPIEESEAEVESELILSHVTGLTRVQRLIAPQTDVLKSWQITIDTIMSQRRLRVPIQYCLGSTKFMGLDFLVEPGVLIPRGDTETLVSIVLNLLSEKSAKAPGSAPISIGEIGVGAGPIAISLLKELPNAKLWGCDVSEKAIELTRRNAQLHGVSDRLKLVLTDWEEALPTNLDLIVANPPYIPKNEKAYLAAEIAGHEPDLALFTDDDDGLEFYKLFARLLPKHLAPGRSLAAFECGDKQARLITSLLEASNWQEVKIFQDVNGIERVVSAIAPVSTLKFG